jgi:hypothetical protein
MREAARGEERLVDVGPSFVADRQAAEAAEPGERALHDPAVPAQALAAFHPASGDPALEDHGISGAAVMSVALALERAVHALGSRLLAERSEAASGEHIGEAELWWRLLTCVLASQVPYETAVVAADRITELWPAGPRPAASDEAADVVEARLRAILQGSLPTSSGARRYRFPQTKARQIARTYSRFRDQRLDLRAMVFAADPVGPAAGPPRLRRRRPRHQTGEHVPP